jgi:ACS family hexuronate transporter-like MFS transporter
VAGGWGSGWLIRAGMAPAPARERVMLACALIATPIALAPHVASHWLAVALLSLTLGAHQGFSVSLFALTTDRVDKARLGGVIGVMAFFGNLAGMVILQAAGWLIDRGFGFGLLFGYCGAAYLLALGWLHLLSSGGREGGDGRA